jgi:signal transduction histidine kinase
VIALAARESIDPAAARRAEAMAARLAPTLDAFTLRREMRTQHALVQSLALRLYGAIDAERARIARDLHDDQAQLMTAARIAIEAPRPKARRILREIEQTLRTRLRDLRPATIGRATLRASLEGERQRLIDAGLEARLLRIADARALSRPLQNVCWQVAREAVSNIIRHARARHVELSLERAGDCVRLKVVDDGCGTRRRRTENPGMGLSGLAERVALIGGTLRVDSHPGGTCVVAEIPALPRASRAPRARKRKR